MGKGSYGDIPEENMVFNYASSQNITMRGSVDSGYTIEEWDSMTESERNNAELECFWASDVIEFWMSKDEETE